MRESNRSIGEQKSGNAISNIFWLLKKIWIYTPGYMFFMVIEGTVWGINHSISILYIKKLFDVLEENTGFHKVAHVIVIYAVYLLFFYMFHHWYWHIYNPIAHERLHVSMNSELFQQALKIDIEKYDDPEFYNDFIWSMESAYAHAIDFMEDTGKLINRIIASITVISVVFSVDEVMALIIIILSCCRVGFTFISNRKKFEFKRELNPLLKKYEYIKRVFRLPDYAKDLRVFHVKEPLLRDFCNNVEEEKKIIARYGKILAGLKAAIYGMMILGENVLIVLVLYKVMVSGELGIGAFAVAVNASWKLAWLMGNMIERLMKYHEHGIFVEKMITFLKCQSTIVEGTKVAEPLQSLVINNLKYRYRKAANQKYAIHNINMRINRGEKIAIVGYNGAGKTTFTKLLMRLYDPSEGEILYNGENIKNFKLSSLRERIAAVFQDYRIFATTIGENVAGGVVPDKDIDRVEDAMHQSTFGEKLKSLPNGIQTQLTREFYEDGIELSGGERQKIAIARALFRNADLVILDEPSSALDPEAEFELNQAISAYTADKTVVFISHRLATTKNADRIYVFEEGEITESGTHEELMVENGKYANMFLLQAEKYRK